MRSFVLTLNRMRSRFDSSMRNREWCLYIADMIRFCEKVISRTEGFDKDEFLDDEVTYESTLWNMRLIGEAATHVPEEVRVAHSQIDWRRVIGMRHQLTHGYLGIDDDVVWDVVKRDVPELLERLRSIIE